MKSTASLFFLFAVVFAIAGMIWGIQMSATHDHSLSPAHGHLNLLGFVAMAVFGTFYALSHDAGASRLAKAHLGLAVVSVVVLIPGIAMAISGNGETLAKVGSALTLLSMVMFGFVVVKFGIGDTEANQVRSARVG